MTIDQACELAKSVRRFFPNLAADILDVGCSSHIVACRPRFPVGKPSMSYPVQVGSIEDVARLIASLEKHSAPVSGEPEIEKEPEECDEPFPAPFPSDMLF